MIQALPPYKPEFYPHNYSKSGTDNYQKRYYLFCGPTYYPRGGWEDFKGNFTSIDEALMFLRRNIEPDKRNWFHVVDIDTQNIVREHPEERSQR